VFEARAEGGNPDAVPRPTLPEVPEGLPDAYRSVARRYEPLLRALADQPRAVTTGDTTVATLFACPPLEAIDLCTYMGGSVPLALGAAAVGKAPAWAVTGDFGFASAGHLGLLEAQQRGQPLNILLLDNGRAHATGGQPVEKEAVDTVLAGYRDHVIPLDAPGDSSACREALRRAALRDDLTIVRAHFRA
jgi:TPP-dependent indolepyruvate ferredoxin oxidoreductase alpha subunit